jgi:hypothetical protein
MSELKMSNSSQTSKTHKNEIESQVTFHSENPNLQITIVKLELAELPFLVAVNDAIH